ncbi:DNA primase [Thiobacter aerophilum]|uniref:DNA primase n=1 Tax=Thiobacter aerophilum TaxID=3121275 RepID=A0ABV0EDW6_9BURK
MIPQSFIEELLKRIDIVEVVGRYVPLKKAGANYSACCPFHKEKTPSFTVSPSKQFYHCFGCGAHGTAIGFLMEYQGIGFPEAVAQLAQSVGLTVPRDVRGERPEAGRDRFAAMRAALAQALHYYRQQLKASSRAIDYLKRRGLSGEIAARFGIGYAPDHWQNLAAVFPDYAASPVLAEAGLVIDHETGRRYDRFRDRIMFPILDVRGDVIGFGGRVLGQGEPKYLNSPETPLFQKGQELYGLAQARRAIREAGRVLVVEGYMDVVALAQHGVEYAVATLGTATTPHQVQRLLRLAERIVFCFDGDAAGRLAAWRALENSLPALTDGATLSFLFLPEGEDPDSFIRAHGRQAFEAQLAQALPLSQFLFRELTTRNDIQSEEGRARLLQEARPLIEQVQAPALAMLLRKRLAELVGLAPAELTALLSAPLKRAGDLASPAPRFAPRVRRAPSRNRQLLRLLLARPALGRGVVWQADTAEDGEGAVVGEVLAYLAAHPHVETGAQLLEAFRDTEAGRLMEEVAAEALLLDDGFDLEREFADALARIEEAARRRRIEGLLALERTQGLTPEQKQLLLRELAATRRA